LNQKSLADKDSGQTICIQHFADLSEAPLSAGV
jgi:hypothetical protein